MNTEPKYTNGVAGKNTSPPPAFLFGNWSPPGVDRHQEKQKAKARLLRRQSHKRRGKK